MVTVKDGMKIGLGLFLFQWFLGAICCVALGGVTWCIVSGSDNPEPSQNAKTTSELWHVVPPEPRPANTSKTQTVEFVKKCNVRSEPDGESEKIGVAIPGKPYLVAKREGQWRNITLDNGKSGWAGCAIAKTSTHTSDL